MFLFQRKAVRWDDTIELRLSGRDETDEENGIRFSVVFDICLRRSHRAIGYISFRYGESPLLYYLGHVGYRINEKYRGHGYARAACALLGDYLSGQGITSAVITTDDTNMASRKTCENLGCVPERKAPVPLKFRSACQGSRCKYRYIWMIRDQDGHFNQ